MTTEFLWNFWWISIRILLTSLSIQQSRWLLTSSRNRWPQNSYKILQGFWSDFLLPWKSWSIFWSKNLITTEFWSEFFSRIRWPHNSYEILQGFWSQFWRPALLSNNSDDYKSLQELDDQGILVKFLEIRWPQNSHTRF